VTIRILLAEDVQILRVALVELLALQDDFEIVAAVGSGAEIVPAALAGCPDVAVLDIALPDLDGISAAELLHEQLPACRVLILTSMNQLGHVHRALTTGVAGFLPKDIAPTDLAKAIRAVADGCQVLDPALTAAALRAPLNPLSQRETEVLRMSATGADPLEVAERLFLSYGTVRNYLASAQTKLDARTRIDAVRIATEAGWI
jgi:two-component system response regulator DesR